jgi:hypothetical protein
MAGRQTHAPAHSWMPELKRSWQHTFESQVLGVVVSGRGKVAVATREHIAVHDAPPGLALRKHLASPEAEVTAVSFNLRGSEIVAGYSGGVVKWWQVESGELTCTAQFPRSDSGGGGDEDADSSAARAPEDVREVVCSRSGLVAAASGR